MKTVLASIAVSLAIAASSVGADWPWFRGPNHDGVLDRPGWAEPLPADAMPAWTLRLGESYSGFAYSDGRIYTLGSSDEGQLAYRIEAATGRVVWQTAFAPQYRDRWGNGPRSTPTLAGGRVFVVGGEGTLACLDQRDGRVLWTQRLGPTPDYGHSGSVLVEGDQAIVAAGLKRGALAAFDPRTGEFLWGVGNDAPGYATPYPFTMDGRRYVAAFLATSVIVADLAERSEVWRIVWRTSWDANASAPIFRDNLLFITSGYGTGAALYELTRQGDRLVHREVWRSGRLQNRFSSFVLVGDYLYGSSEAGRGALVCVEFKTGAVKWQVRSDPLASVKAVGGHLVVQDEGGKVEIAPATPEGYNPVCSAQVAPEQEGVRMRRFNRSWNAPLLIGGRLFSRNMVAMGCVELDER